MAAVIAYARCFATGKRTGLTPSDLEDIGLPEGADEVHQWLWHMRNKHVAHSVNPFEQVVVGAALAPKGQPRAVVGCAALELSYASTNEEGVRQLGLISSTLKTFVAKRCEDLRLAVIQEARDICDISELYMREPMRLTAPGAESVANPRGSN